MKLVNYSIVMSLNFNRLASANYDQPTTTSY